MSKTLDPTYKNPPVKERIIGVQFERLQSFTNAHAGWFWKTFLGEEWSKIKEVPKIEDKFEQFGEDSKKWGVAGPQFQLLASPPSNRFQFTRETDDRMIQIQDTRFHLNWRKAENHDYIDYEELWIEFVKYFDLFKKFCVESNGSEPKLNQWEITYINHIDKGSLWSNVNDWFNLLPGFSLPGFDNGNNGSLETLTLNWAVNLEDNKGRLHSKIQHGLIGGPDGTEIMLLEHTARGPLIIDSDMEENLKFGHDSIVNTFTHITSPDAHKYWERIS